MNTLSSPLRDCQVFIPRSEQDTRTKPVKAWLW